MQYNPLWCLAPMWVQLADIFSTPNAAGNTNLNIVSYDPYAQASGITFNTNGLNERMRISKTGNVGIGTTAPATKLHMSSGVFTIDGTGAGLALNGGQMGSTINQNGNSGAAITVDWSKGNTQHVILTANTTLTFSNGLSGRKYTLILKQDGTGSRTVTWPGAVRFSGGATPTLSCRQQIGLPRVYLQ